MSARSACGALIRNLLKMSVFLGTNLAGAAVTFQAGGASTVLTPQAQVINCAHVLTCRIAYAEHVIRACLNQYQLCPLPQTNSCSEAEFATHSLYSTNSSHSISSLYVLPRAFLAARLLSLVSRTLLVFILSASATNIPAFAFHGLQRFCVRAAWWFASTGGMARVGTGVIVVSITPTDRIAVTKQAVVRITTIGKVASALVAGFSAISAGLRDGN